MTDSAFERTFEAWHAGHTIASARKDKFDLNHGLFYSPISYIPTPVIPKAGDPDEQWIRTSLAAFIRDEFSSAPVVNKLSQTTNSTVPVNLTEIALAMRDRYEQALVYGEHFESRYLEPASDPIAQVYALMCGDALGRAINAENVTIEDFRYLLRHQRVGCRLVVPGLPFRDQNVLRVDNLPSAVTLAEAAFLVRLHCTALAIYQCLPTGADVVVLSDGDLYAPILGVAEADALKYVAEVRQLRDALNLAGTVSIVSLKRLTEYYDNGSGRFADTTAKIQERIDRWCVAPPDSSFREQLAALSRGVRWNMNSKRFGLSMEQLRDWLDRGGTSSSSAPTSEEVTGVASAYAACNLSLQWHQIIPTMLPTTVRATMHPKRGQLALPKLGSCFPWNGVAILNSDSSVEVHSLQEAARRGLKLTRRSDGHGSTVLYEREA